MRRSLLSVARGFGYALAGIAWLTRSQRNARIQLGIGLAAVALGLWLGLSALEWAILALTIGLVLAAEAVNTAIEATVDLASPQWHTLARRAKDSAAGAVLLLAVASVVVGMLLFAARLVARLTGG